LETSRLSDRGNALTDSTPLYFAVFDCDGTLVDSIHSIIEAMSMAWAAEGLGAPPTGHNVRSIVGLQLIEAIGRLYPEGAAWEHERLAQHYKGAFLEIRNRPDHDEPLFEGTREVINALDCAGVLLGIATGKSRRGLEATLERHGLLDRFVSLKTSDDGPGKPNPTILLDAMRELGVESENTVMIGDTIFDVTMAVNAKVTAIGVDWGYHEVSELRSAGAETTLQSFHELEDSLRTIWGKL
jgi:phosphoglycolate phosphatase